MAKEKSYVMVKPGFAEHQWVIEEIKNRLHKAGLQIDEEGFVNYDKKHAREHYAEHVGKDFYPPLEKYITSGKAYGMIVSGPDAILKIRQMVGSTSNPQKGTIRADIPAMMGREVQTRENVIHASDSHASAKKEIKIFKELLNIEDDKDKSEDDKDFRVLK